MIPWLESPSFINAVSVVIGLVTLSILIYQNWWKLPHPRYPSGVRGIPVLGALPFLGEMPHTVLQRWSCEKYGPVMSVRLGPNDAVVLNDYDTITEALVKHRSIFQLRPQLKIITDYSKGYGFGFSDGHKQYLEVRQFTLKALRGIGIGKRKMEVRVFDVAQELVQTLHDLKGKAIDLKMVVNPVVCNVISSVVFGRTFERNDKAFLKIVKSIADSFGDPENSNYILGLLYFPSLRHIQPFKRAYQKFIDVHMEQIEFCRAQIEEHQRNLDENEPTDFIDAFLIEMKKHSPEDSWFHNDQLLQCVADLFLAGTDTSSNTISWAVSVLLHYPDLQTKLYEEISKKTGEKPPAFEHRQELPLLQAFIQEILRCFSIAPLSLQHKTSADVEIGGCFIPKHTLILTNLYAAHHDPKTWKDPSSFNIYRHIDKDGKFVPSKKVISFGIGARSCLGEKLGRIEIFLFLANIIKTFEILPDPKSNRLPPIDRGIAGFLYIPYPFKVVMKSRM